jgi:hypothetical protein
MVEVNMVTTAAEMNQVSSDISQSLGSFTKMKIKADKPSQYRLTHNPPGILNLEAGFVWWQGSITGVDWQVQDTVDILQSITLGYDQNTGQLTLYINGASVSTVNISPPTPSQG